jgi:UPF0042 nucleotide-binding protein
MTTSPITIVTFGFKYGPPATNYCFDVSFLKNPARESRWSLFDAPSADMRDFVLSQPACQTFLDSLLPMLHCLITLDDDVRIGVGCSSGRHRSVIIADEVKRRLESGGALVRLTHREQHSW